MTTQKKWRDETGPQKVWHVVATIIGIILVIIVVYLMTNSTSVPGQTYP